MSHLSSWASIHTPRNRAFRIESRVIHFCPPDGGIRWRTHLGYRVMAKRKVRREYAPKVRQLRLSGAPGADPVAFLREAFAAVPAFAEPPLTLKRKRISRGTDVGSVEQATRGRWRICPRRRPKV